MGVRYCKGCPADTSPIIRKVADIKACCVSSFIENEFEWSALTGSEPDFVSAANNKQCTECQGWNVNIIPQQAGNRRHRSEKVFAIIRTPILLTIAPLFLLLLELSLAI